MNITNLSNFDAIKMMESATELFRNRSYLPREAVEKFIGLTLHRSGFYGLMIGDVAQPLNKGEVEFNSKEDVCILIEGVVNLPKVPVNNGLGGVVFKGLGVLFVNNVKQFDGRMGVAVTEWGSISGDINSQTDLVNLLNTKANVSHTHNASAINAGTFDDARISQSNVTQHESSLSIQSSQVTDFDIEVSNNPSVVANTAKVSANGSVTSHSDVSDAGSGEIITSTERTKLDSIEPNAKDDQSAAEVPFTPNGDLTSTNTQDAIVELRDDTDTKLASKANLVHTHVKADITDFSDADYATQAQGLLADSATQPGDNVSDLTNDAGYLTNETDPVFNASEASNFVAGDKAKLDQQSGVNSGDETTATIQSKRPLKTVEGQSLEGLGNIDITATDVGLGNVDNTSDVDKPVSTAQASADLNVQNFSIQRVNHTGTQLASTISDFDTEVANNASVAANTAKVSADGPISSHSDVNTTGATDGQVLTLSSGNWVPQTPSAGPSLEDTQILRGGITFGTTVGGTVAAGANLDLQWSLILGVNNLGYNITGLVPSVPLSGWYKVGYKVFFTGSNNRTNPRVDLLVNGLVAQGFASADYTRNISLNTGSIVCNLRFPLNPFTINSSLSLRVTNNGTVPITIVPLECSLDVEFKGN
jgi:hypothetical protein